jgi:hypothetical protein
MQSAMSHALASTAIHIRPMPMPHPTPHPKIW